MDSVGTTPMKMEPIIGHYTILREAPGGSGKYGSRQEAVFSELLNS
jgi:hypothetical protein